MTDYSSEDFWEGAPADAQAFMPGSYQWIDGWWKKKGDQFYFWPFALGESGGWASSYARPFVHPDIIMRPYQPWPVDGLPPVGTECEIAASTEYLKISYPEGAKVKIYAHFKHDSGRELAAFVDQNCRVYGVGMAKIFTPIKTPAQIAAEEREAAIEEIEDIIAGFSYRKCAELVYDAGYRKGYDK